MLVQTFAPLLFLLLSCLRFDEVPVILLRSLHPVPLLRYPVMITAFLFRGNTLAYCHVLMYVDIVSTAENKDELVAAHVPTAGVLLGQRTRLLVLIVFYEV